ncbi:unnamed protein product, partial [Prorocentrum cordatum]
AQDTWRQRSPAKLPRLARAMAPRLLALLASASLAAGARLLRNAGADEACVAEETGTCASVPSSRTSWPASARRCARMVEAYPKCSCPDFVEPDSTPGVMTWEEPARAHGPAGGLGPGLDQGVAQAGLPAAAPRRRCLVSLPDRPPAPAEGGGETGGTMAPACRIPITRPTPMTGARSPDGPGAKHSVDPEEKKDSMGLTRHARLL